jgi:excisionase family DNA binding protein
MALDSFQDGLLDTEQAAEYLRVGPQTIRNWRTKGRGPEALKVGSLVRYRRSDLDRWLDEECRERGEGR